MEEKVKKIIEILSENNKTISCMESCTGGALASEITSQEGASNILKFSAVTYSNEYKVKLGVDKKIIERYTVYSKETAKEMSKKISDFSNSNIGIGITGKLNRPDENNSFGKDNEVFISVYNSDKKIYIIDSLVVEKNTRKENKNIVVEKTLDMILKQINI